MTPDPTDPTRTALRRRMVRTATIGVITCLVIPLGALAVSAGDLVDVAADAQYYNRTILELSDDLDEQYTNRVDVINSAPDEGSYSRVEEIYIDLELRADCTIVDRNSATPALECTRAPQPTKASEVSQ